MSDNNSLDKPKPRRTGCIIAVALLLVMAVGAIVLGRSFWQAREQALRIANEFRHVLNFTPEVRVNSRVVIAATTPILELATVQKQAVVQHSWSQTWLHSTKTIEVEATFTARAGFDLRRPFTVNIDTKNHTFSAQLPPAKILSLGMSDVRILRDEDGLWNKLSAADREDALRELEMTARLQFHQTDILKEARAEGEKQVRQLLESASHRENFHWIDSPPKP
jgi:Protein of unknown function (DUF4230)